MGGEGCSKLNTNDGRFEVHDELLTVVTRVRDPPNDERAKASDDRAAIGFGSPLKNAKCGGTPPPQKCKRSRYEGYAVTIVTDEDVLGGEPRIEGTRVGVRHVAEKVIDGGRSPAYVADQLDCSLASVYEALAYYYDNIEEIREIERENERAFEHVRESSLRPNKSVS